MAQVGRISGPLLTDNLERNGRNISIRNFPNDPALLHLDVNQKFIGINQSSPIAEIDINSYTKSLDNISDTGRINNNSFYGSNIEVAIGNLYLNANNTITASGLSTDDIIVSDNTIATKNNASLYLEPDGSGKVIIPTNLNVYGNLHATNDIIIDGQVTFGDNDNEDTVTFRADVNSSLILTQNNTFKLGSATKFWQNLYVDNASFDHANLANLSIDNIEFSSRQGNIFYVAVNGDDTNVGDHPNGPFRTIQRALQAADASIGGPVTIHVYPGTYEEELPLVVPTNVTVSGEDIRNVIVKPAVGYGSNDVFLLNGETTIQNLSIKDTTGGYAFRFDTNAIVSSRSPYIQNVTVITAANGGNGALVDGADVDPNSNEASMLFHSCTFITPGTDALTVTNGARVEWLNSFTYYANRGIYAYNGTTGHLSSDGSTINYGAEIRSIGSANIYGTYGVVGDGNQVLLYLINHNLAYIGTGIDSTNDKTLSIPSNEIVKTNNAKIYFQSIDHKGKFAVGDTFFVDQKNNTTSLSIDETNISSLSGLTITTNNDTTFIDGEKILVGNFIFRDNDIKTTTGEINLESQSLLINFQDNVNIRKNLNLNDNLTMSGGAITFGDESTDILEIAVDFNDDLVPTESGTYDLGSIERKWKSVNLNEANISDVLITNNYITTAVSNADLDLRTNGSGNIVLDDSLYINGETFGTLQDTFKIQTSNNLDLSSNTALVLPIGLTNQRILDVGNIRFNSEDIIFEGFGNTNIINFTGVYSSDKNTSVTVDPIANILNFVADTNKTQTINNQGINVIRTEIDSFIFDNNSITTNSITDILFNSNGSGYVNLSDLLVKNNTFTNTSANDLLIVNTGTGYTKITGNNGVVIPSGDSNSRGLTNYVGEMRHNTDTDNLEVYTGTDWILAGGEDDTPVDDVIMAEIVDEIILIYG